MAGVEVTRDCCAVNLQHLAAKISMCIGTGLVDLKTKQQLQTLMSGISLCR